MVAVTTAAYRRTNDPSRLTWSEGRCRLFCVHQMNRVKYRNHDRFDSIINIDLSVGISISISIIRHKMNVKQRDNGAGSLICIGKTNQRRPALNWSQIVLGMSIREPW